MKLVNITSWNINGIKARYDNLLEYLKIYKPDIIGLQEIKCINENFPREEIESLGYNIEVHGQKSFNGVALLSLLPFEEVNKGLYKQDEQARFIEGVVSIEGQVVRVACLYLPNGNPTMSDKYKYKLKWMDELKKWCVERLKLEEPLVIFGDFNVIPQDVDCWDINVWKEDALALPEVREKFRSICNLGFTEAVRNSTDEKDVYTFWDFQKGAWQKNHGIRIDHFLLSPEIAGFLTSTRIDKETRGWEKPSDHVPVNVGINLNCS